MRLIASLTTLTASALLAATLTGCAGNAPKRPTAEQDKSLRSSALDNCTESQMRGTAAPTADCPYDATEPRRTRRTAPGLQADPTPLPGMPGLELPATGSILGR